MQNEYKYRTIFGLLAMRRHIKQKYQWLRYYETYVYGGYRVNICSIGFSYETGRYKSSLSRQKTLVSKIAGFQEEDIKEF